MTKASDNVFARLRTAEGTAWATPSSGEGVLYAKSSDSLLYYKNDAGTEYTLTQAAGNYTGVAWSSGTAMPGGPSTNQRVTRTDLDMDFTYNGTRWLSVQRYTVRSPGGLDPNGEFPAATTGTTHYFAMHATDFDIWLETWYVSTVALATNNGTSYWTCTLQDADGTSLGSFNTSADTAGVKTDHKTTINALLGTTFATQSAWIQITQAKTVTPGNLYLMSNLTYRLVGT